MSPVAEAYLKHTIYDGAASCDGTPKWKVTDTVALAPWELTLEELD